MTSSAPADDSAEITAGQETNNRETVRAVVEQFNVIASKDDAIKEIAHDASEDDLRNAIRKLPKEAQSKILGTYNEAMEQINRPDLVETPEQADRRHLKMYVYKLFITVGVVLTAFIVLGLLYALLKSGNASDIVEVLKTFGESVAEIVKVIFESRD